MAWENLDNQDYHLFEYRKIGVRFSEKNFSQLDVCHGDIQCKTKYEGNFFDRIVAIHVLEHLPDLPLAVDEFSRILKPDGHLDVVLPCEGGWAYEFARQISSARMFKRSLAWTTLPSLGRNM
ncbi:MAG: class I SAM-dependent methyltransferase [Bdellovibrionales bacterium]|nr:class I SAM-dependent methyltransferase [Bdellovibrionales bacterium]